MGTGCGMSSRRAVRRAVSAVLENLESRRLLSAGDLLGVTTTDCPGTAVDAANNATRQADGKLVVVGQSANRAAIARYNTDGSLDPNFGGHGVTFIDSRVMGGANSVVEDSQHRLIVGGQ